MGAHSPASLSCLPAGTPHALIVRRYLSLLDTAVELELPAYRGPRLPRRQQVPIFPQPLITDRARCKYRWGSPGRGKDWPERSRIEKPGELRTAWVDALSSLEGIGLEEAKTFAQDHGPRG